MRYIITYYAFISEVIFLLHPLTQATQLAHTVKKQFVMSLERKEKAVIRHKGVVHGHHIRKYLEPKVLAINREVENAHDHNAVAVFLSQAVIVGHV